MNYVKTFKWEDSVEAFTEEEKVVIDKLVKKLGMKEWTLLAWKADEEDDNGKVVKEGGCSVVSNLNDAPSLDFLKYMLKSMWQSIHDLQVSYYDNNTGIC